MEYAASANNLQGSNAEMGADVEQNDDDNWVALRGAAAILGVSVDTVKRRMQKGELEHRRETIPQGFRWLVRVDPVISKAIESTESDETPSQGSQYLRNRPT